MVRRSCARLNYVASERRLDGQAVRNFAAHLRAVAHRELFALCMPALQASRPSPNRRKQVHDSFVRSMTADEALANLSRGPLNGAVREVAHCGLPPVLMDELIERLGPVAIVLQELSAYQDGRRQSSPACDAQLLELLWTIATEVPPAQTPAAGTPEPPKARCGATLDNPPPGWPEMKVSDEAWAAIRRATDRGIMLRQFEVLGVDVRMINALVDGLGIDSLAELMRCQVGQLWSVVGFGTTGMKQVLAAFALLDHVEQYEERQRQSVEAAKDSIPLRFYRDQ